MSATSSLRSLAHWLIRAPHDQLTAAGIHRRLRVVGLAILMVLALAHQPAVRVAQIALRGRSRRPGRRLRMLALGTTTALLPRRHLGLIGLPLRRRPRLRLRLQTATGRIELVAQGLAAGNLLRQRLRIILASHVRRLRPAQQRRDLAFQLGDQRTRALVPHRAMLAGVGLELGAVDAHQAYAQQLQLLGQKKNLQEALPTPQRSSPAGSARSCRGRGDGSPRRSEPRYRGASPARSDGWKRSRWRSSRSSAPASSVGDTAPSPVPRWFHLEGAQIDTLHRLDHEVPQIIRREPVPQIGRKQKRLVPITVHEVAHRAILRHIQPKVRQTARTGSAGLGRAWGPRRPVRPCAGAAAAPCRAGGSGRSAPALSGCA